MNPRMNPFWRQRMAGTFHNTLDAYPRVLMLRFPDCPAAVISRFTDPLKAKIDAYIKRKQHEGKRVHATTLRFIWVREFGERNGKKHYHVVLLLNRDTWCGAGDYRTPDSLAGLIKQAWCSALRVDAQQYSSLANFPQNPVLWLDRGNAAQLQQGLARADYLAKHHTKERDGERNFGCSQN